MGYEKHVGRIGALAFALGVGIGVSTSPGVALADDTGGSTSSTGHSSPGTTGAGGADSGDKPSGASTSTDITDSRAGQDTDAPAEEAPAADPPSAHVDTDAEVDTDEAAEPQPVRKRSGRAVAKRRLHADMATASTDNAPAAQPDVPAAEASSAVPTAEPVVDVATTSAPTVPTAPTVSTEAPGTVTVSAPVDTVDTPVTRATTVKLTDLLSTLLAPGGAPATPVESPAWWVLAAAARRQLGQTETAPISAARTAAFTTALIEPAHDPVADTPAVNDPDASGIVTGWVIVSDADGDPLTAVASTPGKGSVTVSQSGDTFSFTYRPTRQARHAAAALGAPDDVKADNFVLTISDGTGGQTTVPITVTVAPANAVPTARARTSGGLFSAEVRGRIIDRDTDRDPITFTASPTAKGGALEIDERGRFTYTPTDAARHAAATADATDADRQDTFDVTVADGHGGTTTITVTVRVKPGNDAPTATVRTRSSFFSPNVTGVVRASDIEKDGITFSASPSAKGGTVTIDDRGRFVYVPTEEARHAAAASDAPRRDKQETFTIDVSDDHGGTTRIPVTVRIKPANAAPAQAAATDVFTNPNTGVVTGKIVAVDPDEDTFTYAFPAETRKGGVSIDEDGSFTYTPTAEARAQASKPFAPPRVKTDAFRVAVDDGHGGTTMLTVRVGITPLGSANQAPTDGGYTVGAPNALSGKVTGTATAVDPDRDLLTFIGSGPTAKGNVVVNADGSFAYTPTAAARHQVTADNATPADKEDTFTITALDGFGGSLTIPVTVAVKPSVNRAPTRGSYTSSADPVTAVVTGTATARDADLDPLTFSGTTTTAKGGVVVYSAGDFTYTPTDDARAAAGAPGASLADKHDTFEITVDDGHGGTLAISVRVPIVAAAADSPGLAV